MALPSQSGVQSGGRSMMFRRKRRNLPPGLIPVMALLVLAGVAYLAWRQFGGPRPADAATDNPQQATADDQSVEELLRDRDTAADGVQPADHPGFADRPQPGVLASDGQSSAQRAPTRRDASGSLLGAIDRSAPAQHPAAGSETTTTAPSTTAPTTTTKARPPQAKPDAGLTRADESSSAGVKAAPAQRTDRLITTGQLATLVRLGQKKLDENKPVEARELFNRALARASGGDATAIRRKLGELNDELVFSPRIYPGDPLAFAYKVKGGDALSKIVRGQDLAVDWRLIQWVNRLSSPSKIRQGQKIKLVRGPFHAVVHKNAYRLDLFWGPPDERSEWVYIRSFPVGLGTGGSTPIGSFRVRDDGKLVNPGWANPRTGERFSRNDPKNPIGEYWVGIEGIGDSAVHEGYGLHGTIEPDSIGRQASMGCVRLRDKDIELVFSMLTDGLSRVEIEP